MEYNLSSLGMGFGGFLSFWMLVGLLWVIVWKGWALWIAAREGSKAWFIALLVINTLGVLEMLYIFFFSKDSKNRKDYFKKGNAEKISDAKVVDEDSKE